MKRFFQTVIVLVTIHTIAFAQQDAEYSMYMFNGLYLNPAYAGSHELISMSGIYRHQWSGIEGAPRSASFGIHTPFRKEQHAVGLLLTNDRLGVTNMYSVNGSYAFRAKINNTTKLSLGVSLGFTQYLSDLTELVLPTDNLDPTFAVDRSLFMPNMGFGAYLFSNVYYVGFSVPHLINNSMNEKLEFEATDAVARQYKHYMATAGYVFGPEDAKLRFKPSILMKYVKNAPIDFDLNASLLIDSRYWVGLSYRTGGNAEGKSGDAIVGIFEFKATSALRLGYAYDYTISDLGAYNTGTHEIMVGFDFGFEKERFVSPRYVKYF
ncbi:MAG: type IX secretion system membrane protein PorP/SprF [Chitinophagales bacterium]|nr:type IX secretion system membrane protein PorP/SprF [Chitinophagales bacterium]